MSLTKKILVIENDQFQSLFITECLSESPYQVVNVLTTGEDAIAYIKDNPVDLILCDIQLDGKLNGTEAAMAIQAITPTPIIFLSASIYKEAIKSNPYGYLHKPFTYDQLIIVIEIAFNRVAIDEELLSSQAHLKQAQRLANIGSWQWNIKTGEISWTDQIYRIFGLQPQQFTPTYQDFIKRIHPDDQQDVINAVNNTVENNEEYDIEHRIITPDNEIRYVHEIGEVKYNQNNQAVHMIGTVNDITEQKNLAQELKKQAFHDALTGLPNRSLLIDRLEHQLAVSKRNSTRFAVLFIDLDKFKPINDFYGHKAGDTVLKKIAYRLKQVTRDSDTIARIGGDEFIILQTDIKSAETVHASAVKFIAAIERPVRIQDAKVTLSASIGFAIYPDNALNINELLTQSDNAMYKAKKSFEIKISQV